MKNVIKYVVLISSIIAMIGFAIKGSTSNKEFDSKKWKNWTEKEEEIALRWNMMNSLRGTYDLKGKTKKEIIELLGEPDGEKNNFNYRYYLGMANHGIDTGSLIIRFNEEGVVFNFWVWNG